MFALLFAVMASVFRKHGSPFWFAAYRDALGNRAQKTTKQRERRVALRMAIELERLAAKGRAGTLTEAQARKVVSEIVEDATGEPLQFHTVRAWFEEWLAGKKGAVDPKSLTKYEQVTSDFLDHLGARAEQSLAVIGPKDVRSFRDFSASSGRSASTVNQTIRKVLSAPFGSAVRLGYISTNPCAAVESLSDDALGHRQPFEAVHVRQLLGVADSGWKGAILFGYHTALRFRDITELTWGSIDLENATVTITPRKSKGRGLRLVIPLHPDVITWLREQPRGIAKASVFPDAAARPTGGRNGLSNQFKALMARAGVKGQVLRKKRGAGRETSSLSFHSLRHSCISAMANAGVDKELRMKLSGHADGRSHDLYTHHGLESLRCAVAKVPSIAP
jgi:integrase